MLCEIRSPVWPVPQWQKKGGQPSSDTKSIPSSSRQVTTAVSLAYISAIKSHSTNYRTVDVLIYETCSPHVDENEIQLNVRDQTRSTVRHIRSRKPRLRIEVDASMNGQLRSTRKDSLAILFFFSIEGYNCKCDLCIP